MKGEADPASHDRHAVPADAMSAGLRLAVDAVSHAYGHAAGAGGITLTAEPGEVMVLVGPSGCGKSTLLGIMGGMLAPTAGAVRCEGDSPTDCLNPLTYVFQDFSLLPWRTRRRQRRAGAGRPAGPRERGADRMARCWR